MKRGELLYKELSYKIYGFLFYIHNKLGRFCKEKGYADALEIILKENKIPFTREEVVPTDVLSRKMNLFRTDFIIDDKVVVEMKAKNLLTRDDYFQVFNYLKTKNIKLGLLVNFRSKFLKPKRVLNSLVN
ncbi:MAG: GxxExxY protein [Patescibacteria group bacterium]